MPNEIIIYQPWGGLGDNLSHSVIPELCHKLKIPCYLSNQNVCRNQEIHDFVWGLNPYIIGKKDNNDIDTWLNVPLKTESNREWNEMKNIQLRYGLEPMYHYPIIYYQPKLIPELVDASVFDLCTYSFYTQFCDCNIPENMVILNNIIEQIVNVYKFENIIHLLHKATYTIKPNIKFLDNIKTYNINDLKHYADIMFSCKNYISVTSGQSVLCSTIKNMCKTKTNIYMFTFERFTPPTNYQFLHFKNTNYITLDTLRVLPNEE